MLTASHKPDIVPVFATVAVLVGLRLKDHQCERESLDNPAKIHKSPHSFFHHIKTIKKNNISNSPYGQIGYKKLNIQFETNTV
jgi:hypothetical protein